MNPIAKPGQTSKMTIVLVFFATVILCILSAIIFNASTLWTAIIITAISLIGFHLIALYTFEYSTHWKYIDYPWILVAFMTIMIGITTIQENVGMEPFKNASLERKRSYDAFLYSLKTVIYNDCDPRLSTRPGWNNVPEPYKGACAKFIHFLPMLEKLSSKEISTNNLNSDVFWAGTNVRSGLENALGSWKGLDDTAQNFVEKIEELKNPVEVYEQSRQSFTSLWIRSEAFKYWYYLLAFLLGLRLSKN
jgi:energy-coupling factor transporter transmembrane protein EcfT